MIGDGTSMLGLLAASTRRGVRTYSTMATTRIAAPSWRRYRAVAARAASLNRYHAPLALGLYLVAALIIERQAVVHLRSVCACNGGSDPTQFMWALEWWPHALLHGVNPFITHEIWVSRGGFNLAAGTSMPGLALLAAPLTAVVGPLATFNVLSLLAPVLSAWFAYRLCLYVTNQPAASIVGGYLFGFSTYELSHLIGLMHTVFVFTLPAVALLTLRRLDLTIGRRAYFLLMTLLLSFQLLVSAELLLTLTCMGVVVLGLSWILAPSATRRRIQRLALPLLAAYAATALICAPFLYYLLQAPGYSQGWGQTFSADALEFAIPTLITRVGAYRFLTVSSLFPGDPTENGAYLGLPLIIIVVAFVAANWRTRRGKLLTLSLGIAALWSLGAHLWIAGHSTIPLPWSIFDGLPLFNQLLPVRLAAYTALIAAVIAASWLSSGAGRTWLRWVVALAAIAFLVPNTAAKYPGTQSPMFHAAVVQPKFFTSDVYKRYLKPDEVILPLPFGSAGSSLLWQADTHMYFRLASGYFGNPPPSYADEPIVQELLANAPAATAPSQLRAFIIERHVAAVVAQQPDAGPWASILTRLGLRRVPVGGVDIYRIPPAWRSLPAGLTARGESAT